MVLAAGTDDRRACMMAALWQVELEAMGHATIASDMPAPRISAAHNTLLMLARVHCTVQPHCKSSHLVATPTFSQKSH